MSTEQSMLQDTNQAIAEKSLTLAEAMKELARLEEQTAKMSDEVTLKRKAMRQRYSEMHAERFKDMDYKLALIGAKVDHVVSFKGVADFYIRPPSGAISHAVDAFIGTAGELGPITNAERILLCWLTGLQITHTSAGNTPKQELSGLAPKDKVAKLRALPEDLLHRLANECVELQQWLNVVLEIDLGNF
jgi:hypothetical protein